MPTSTLFAAVFAIGVAQADPCPRQPLPPATDALAPLDGRNTISFAATPSLDYPGRAWVVRLSRSGQSGPAAAEIVRLRRQSDCNRYDVEKRWEAALPADEFAALSRQVVSLATPPVDVFAPASAGSSFDEVVIDGTPITVSVTTFSWEATARLHHSGRNGAAISALFRELVGKYVPAPELPTEYWRVRR